MADQALTFAFVDLAGFTALTEAHGDEEAAALIDRFEAMAQASVVSQGRLVKVIGDAAFLAFDSPRHALRAVEALLRACDVEPGFPIPRTGMHHGTAVRRGDDFIGGAVNLAARIAGQAQGAQVLATRAVATCAEGNSIRVIEMGEFQLRNIAEPVSIFELGLHPDIGNVAVDPVCRMRVARGEAGGRLRYADFDYWFCSLGCAGQFAGDPDRYHGRPGTEPPRQG